MQWLVLLIKLLLYTSFIVLDCIVSSGIVYQGDGLGRCMQSSQWTPTWECHTSESKREITWHCMFLLYSQFFLHLQNPRSPNAFSNSSIEVSASISQVDKFNDYPDSGSNNTSSAVTGKLLSQYLCTSDRLIHRCTFLTWYTCSCWY